jgi:hypothetical protein
MKLNQPGAPQITPHEPEHVGSRRDPEERPATHHQEVLDKTLDKTLADSFPTSDPPSSIPNPGSMREAASGHSKEKLLADLPPGSWASISDQEGRVVGAGATREEAVQSAAGYQESDLRVVQVPQDPEAPGQAA